MAQHKMELSFKGAEALEANFRNLDRRADRALDATVRRFAKKLYDTTYKRTPVDTKFMQDHLRLIQTRRTFEVGWDASDFFDALKVFYPEFVEFGTRYMAGRFPLTSSVADVMPEYYAEIRNVIRGSIERGSF